MVSGCLVSTGSAQLIEQPWRVGGTTMDGNSILNSKASLKTDPELESILEKAERFRKEKQYNISSKLWQSVLERSGDALFSEDDQIFYSLSQQVEQIIAGLPPEEGLSVYRITADAGAKEILAGADGPFDVRALQQVVRKYFVSSLGDDAALTLSSIYMDDYDFVGAIRMLRKIVDQFPDPSISMVEVYGRLAICQSLMGEKREAEKSLAMAKSLPTDSQSVKLDDIQSLIDSNRRVDGSNASNQSGYAAALANRNRTGVMPSLPTGILENDLTAIWQYFYEPDSRRWPDVKRVKPIMGPDTAELAEATVRQKESSMIDKWRKRGWRPSGTLLFDQGRVYFKTVFDLTVWSSDADSDKVIWRPLWRNKYKMDDYNSALMEVRRTFNRRGHLKTDNNGHDLPYEIQLFADRISSQMSIPGRNSLHHRRQQV